MPLNEDKKFSMGQNYGSSTSNRQRQAQSRLQGGQQTGYTPATGTRMRRSLPAMQPAGTTARTMAQRTAATNTGTTPATTNVPTPTAPAQKSWTSAVGGAIDSTVNNFKDDPVKASYGALQGAVLGPAGAVVGSGLATGNYDILGQMGLRPDELNPPAYPDATTAQLTEIPAYQSPEYQANPLNYANAYNQAQQGVNQQGQALNQISGNTAALNYQNPQAQASYDALQSYMDNLYANNPYSGATDAATVQNMQDRAAYAKQQAMRNAAESSNAMGLANSGFGAGLQADTERQYDMDMQQQINDYLSQREQNRANYNLGLGNLGTSATQTFGTRENNAADFGLNQQKQLADVASTVRQQDIDQMYQSGRLTQDQYNSLNDYRQQEAQFAQATNITNALQANNMAQFNSQMQYAAETGNWNAIWQAMQTNAANEAEINKWLWSQGLQLPFNIIGAGTGIYNASKSPSGGTA